MSKTLIIAEKPSVARDIAQALGGFSKNAGGWLERPDAIVSSGIGHLVTLHVPEAQSTGKDLDTLPVIPARFGLQVLERTKSQFNLLSRLMKRDDVTQVVNACDAGREGELIFRLIYEAAGCKKPMRRMWLQSMTVEALRQAFDDMRMGAEFDALADAAKCRSEADWLIGINGSRGITRLNERQKDAYEQMTAGRVQTPTLAIAVHRENEIRNFVPQDYWEVHATFSANAGSYVGRWIAQGAQTEEGDDPDASGARIFDKAQAMAIVGKCQGVPPSSVTDESKGTSSLPPRLFDLTTLQREANKRFKFSAKRTLEIAQALYEKHKATTYPRTDATALPEDYVQTAKEVFSRLGHSASFGEHASRVLTQGWVDRADKRVFDNSKISDHFAIIPTTTTPSGLDADEAKIYDLVVRRFIAVFHPPARYNVTTRLSIVSGETFKSTGKVLVDPGWLVVYGKQSDDDKTAALCAVQPGEPVQTRNVEAKGMQTKPPARFTEATLLAAMEGAGKLVEEDELRSAMSERGLGTPATRAATIEGLLADKDGQGRSKEPYLRREGKEQYLVPTPKGMGLVAFLEGNGVGMLTSPKMTGEWEQKLRLMEKGQYERRAFMDEIATLTRDMLDAIRKKAAEIPAPVVTELSAPCPACGHQGVRAKTRAFECARGCGWTLRREIAKRDLTDGEAQQLLQAGAIKQLDGFVSSKGRKFSAGLKIGAEHKVEFVFEERAEAPLGASIGAPCPNCGNVVHAKGGDHPQFVCVSGDFKLWRVIAGRALSDDEARELLTNGNLAPVHGFVSSRTRNKFTAGLRLSEDNSKVEFVFEPR